MKAIRHLPLLLFFLLAKSAFSQNTAPILERVINLQLRNERLDVALKRISEQGDFSFSYRSSLLDGKRVVTYDIVNKTVREVLDHLFNGTLEYKIRGRHLILTKAATSRSDDDEMLTGYVIDEATGKRLKNVSVYDPVTLNSAVTDSYGYFEIKVNKDVSDYQLSVNKQSYTDTTVSVPQGNRRLLNIPIRIDKQKIAVAADSVGQKIARFWRTKILNPQLPNLVNIDDTLYRSAQFSLLPFIGTNHELSGNVINEVSFNLLGGYALGSEVFELGGLFNIDRGDVEGVQVGGLFNAVGGGVRGGQVAGLFNANYAGTRGGQVAGLANINWDSTSYGSVAGLANFTRHRSYGAHVAGLSNFTLGEQVGPHIAGLFNFATDDSQVVQVAGGFNFAKESFTGLQVGGIFNFTTKSHDGVQIAGLMNFSGKEIHGVQIGGFNYGKKINGAQIGVINISDSIKGVPVGILSIVASGYHKLEVSADEIFYANIAFRTGVHQFYNIITAGAKPETFEMDSTYWTLGYGVGTAPRLSRRLSLNFDITANQIFQERDIDAVNLLNKLYVGFDWHWSKSLSLTFGATLNGYVTEATNDNYLPLFSDYQPAIILDKTYSNDLNLKMWWGAKIGLRFL